MQRISPVSRQFYYYYHWMLLLKGKYSLVIHHEKRSVKKRLCSRYNFLFDFNLSSLAQQRLQLLSPLRPWRNPANHAILTRISLERTRTWLVVVDSAGSIRRKEMWNTIEYSAITKHLHKRPLSRHSQCSGINIIWALYQAKDHENRTETSAENSHGFPWTRRSIKDESWGLKSW